MYTTEEIAAIAAIPDTAFKYKQQFQSLLDFYLWIKDTWTATAIKQLATDNSLSLRGHENKAKFARLAAQTMLNESQPILCPSQPDDIELNTTSHVESQDGDDQDGNDARPIALLAPVTFTNGLENAPAWQILGSPISRLELEQNFKKLLWYWHPDKNADPSAKGRMSLISAIYRLLSLHWEAKYNPLLPIEKLNKLAIEKAKQKAYDWSPESFWTDEIRSKSFNSLKAGI